MLSLYAASSAYSGSAACSDDEGCNLNGRCTAGTCQCLSAWSGAESAAWILIPPLAAPTLALHQPNLLLTHSHAMLEQLRQA